MADRETDRFLQSLYQHAKQDGEDPEAVAKRVYQNARGVSRRELLGGAGALGLGAAMGGGGAIAATGNAAASNHNDSDGNVGDPNDRVDVFGETVDSNSVTTDEVNNVAWSEKKATLRDALDAVGSFGEVILENTYDETITITTDNRKLSGVSNQNTGIVVSDDSNPALSIDNRGTILTDLKLQNDGSAEILTVESTGSEAAFRGIKTFTNGGGGGITIAGDRCMITGNDFGGEDITLDGDSVVLVGNTRVGTVTDNGTANVVSPNA